MDIVNSLSSRSCSSRINPFFLLPSASSVTSVLCKRHVYSSPTPKHRLGVVYCTDQLPTKSTMKIRRYAPLLEKTTLEHNDVLGSTATEWKALPDIWRTTVDKYGDQIALIDPHHDPPSQLTYRQLEQEILDFAEGLRIAGICPDEKVSLFADNSYRWLVADQGIMGIGAVDVVRGSRSSNEELLHIYNHSDSVALVIDNPSLLDRLAPSLNALASIKFVVLLWGKKSTLVSFIGQVPLYDYEELICLGRKSRKFQLKERSTGDTTKHVPISSNDVATIVYTSGTTGNPKGVILTHGNLLHQALHLGVILPVQPGDRFLSYLPSWHMYERSVEYFIFTHGVVQVYTNVKNLKDDLIHYRPTFLVSVPLIYENLYNGIQKQLSSYSGARQFLVLGIIRISMMYMKFKRIYEGKSLSSTIKQQAAVVATVESLWAGIIAAVLFPFHLLGKSLYYTKIWSENGLMKIGLTAGASIPLHVDQFFEAIGITLLNAYGLTEMTSIYSGRKTECNVLGTAGMPLHGIEVKVVDPDTGAVLNFGKKGLIKVRGPQLMKGYYKNIDATMKAIDKDNWLDTGDLGWLASKTPGGGRHCGGMMVVEGRAKDTIVLSTGENVEPIEIEAAALESNLIEQIVVVGQDQRRLGALIVPNMEAIQLEARELAKSKGIKSPPTVGDFKELIRRELIEHTSRCPFHIGPFVLLEEQFTVDSGLLTPTLKVRREKIQMKFQDKISNMFQKE